MIDALKMNLWFGLHGGSQKKIRCLSYVFDVAIRCSPQIFSVVPTYYKPYIHPFRRGKGGARAILAPPRPNDRDRHFYCAPNKSASIQNKSEKKMCCCCCY